MSHPMLANGSEIEILGGELTHTEKTDHESVYNIKFRTEAGYTRTVGYSRNTDGGEKSGITHGWVCFGSKCNSTAKMQQAMDLLLS